MHRPRLAWVYVLVVLTIAGCDGEEAATTPASNPATMTSVPVTATATLSAPSPTDTPIAPTVTPVPTPTTPIEPTPTTPLASWGRSAIYVMQADGSNQHLLGDESLKAMSQAAWSPDGSRIAFVSNRTGVTTDIDGALQVMDADGANLRTLSHGFDLPPTWSPDGRQIAFARYGDDHPDLYVVDADGGNERRLTTSNAGARDPSWSPDGTTIAFALSTDDGSQQLALIDAAGGDPRTLDIVSASDMSPAWSPDGAQIAFVSTDDHGNQQIFVARADGADVRRLSRDAFNDYSPNWSPDGTSIIFTQGNYQEEEDIYVMQADGSNVRQLTAVAHSDGDPAWSPDGTLIAFTTNREGGQPIECNWLTSYSIAAIPSVEALVWMSHQIVVGTVTEILPPAFGAEQDMVGGPIRTIFTDYAVQVERRFRESPGDAVLVRQQGGTIGACAQTVEGQEPLVPGQRLLLFLTLDDANPTLPTAYWVTGVMQGNWPVAPDDTVLPAVPPPGAATRLTLDEVAALIQATLAGDPPSDAFRVVPLEDAPAVP